MTADHLPGPDDQSAWLKLMMERWDPRLPALVEPFLREHFPDAPTEALDAFQRLVAPEPKMAGKLPGEIHEKEPDSRDGQRIGRYRIVKTLGKGGFGVVHLAYDDQKLHRFVAIKVPHSHRIATAEAAEAYLTEARIVASLEEHPNIVRVYDVGSTKDYPFFIVSKYIDGIDLAKRLKQSRLPIPEAVDLVATVAEALHYAHKQGVVHRDIKPGNILLDKSGKPFVADFGLALREQDLGKGSRCAGTPDYMSPEQACGEGHRVDGRSDVFSLGVAFYELLVGRLPFRAPSQADPTFEPRPLRQWDESIPKELERICLKALAMRTSERYSTASDMADDLRHFQNKLSTPATPGVSIVHVAPIVPPPLAASGSETPATPATQYSDSRPIKIVPKGLRSFDDHDSDFFLELLPGPRDRDGLPDSLRFWKTRIEEKDAECTFSVGLIYGPSGCGKSSFVKAGLLPRLCNETVVTVYVEATAEETETRLLNGLRKRCRGLPANLGLKETLLALRRGQGIEAGKKVLIVLDQFEQWLHAKKEEENSDLVQALRQCDGGRAQCVVMVRDDFWMAASRFMRALEVRLLEGQNSAAVDLFPIRHAEKVLAAFGRAFGSLPDGSTDESREQKQFLERATLGLAQDGKVVCVRLALFAEMMKGKAWTPTSLKAVGGTEGVGAAFLEETFSAATAPPEHRYHQNAARKVLKSLLPESGTDIKGHMRSHAELLEASGYGSRPKEFDDLIRILDNEVRLITPTDPEGKDTSGDSVLLAKPGQKYYQLTHDYLVHSLRDWLNSKKRKPDLLLEYRSAQWNAKPEPRYLPSTLEWAQIRLLTKSCDWTSPQRKMMRKADRHYLVRCLGLLAASLLLIWIIGEYSARSYANDLRNHLLTAEMEEVPALLREIESRRERVIPLLRESLESETDPRRKLKLRLGLAHSDLHLVPILCDQLLEAPPGEFAVILQVLEDFKDDVTGRLWAEMDNKERSSDLRFRAACALVEYAKEDPRWDNAAMYVVNGLVAENPLALDHWKAALKPVRIRLLPALAESLENRPAAEHRAVIDFYRHFAGNDPEAYKPLHDRMKAERPGVDQAENAKRKAAVAAALVALDKGDEVWPLLRHSSNPTVRSFLIERLATAGVDPRRLKERLERETNVSVRRALILSLGGFSEDRAPELVHFIADLYEKDPDCGIHGAARWVLAKWDRLEIIIKVDRQLEGTHRRTQNWYTSASGIPFAIIDVPPSNGQTSYRLAVSATEVTVAQFRALWSNHKFDDKFAKDHRCPVSWVSWDDAAEFCNRLSRSEGLRERYKVSTNGTVELIDETDGYRLPTEQEWGFACCVGALTKCGFGISDEELANNYAWWFGNARRGGVHLSFPVALLKPNDFGLFDLQGNVAEWCQDSSTKTLMADRECAVRGGSFRADYRKVGWEGVVMERSRREDSIGFRPVRTLH